MMDRSQKLTILQSMSDENLSAALEAIGIDCCDKDEYGENAAGSGSNIATWSQLDVSVPGGGNRGPIADKNLLFKTKEPVMKHDQLGLQQPGESEEMMLAAGLV